MMKLSKSICAVMRNKQKNKQTIVIIVIRALGQTITRRCLETIPHYHSLYTYACQLTLLQTFHIYKSESQFILASGLYIK